MTPPHQAPSHESYALELWPLHALQVNNVPLLRLVSKYPEVGSGWGRPSIEEQPTLVTQGCGT